MIDLETVIHAPDEILDEELAGMFPKGRTRICDIVMIDSPDGFRLIRKDDIARAEKMREDVIRALLLSASGFSIGCMAALIAIRIIHPFYGLPVIGAALIILGAVGAMKKRRPPVC